MSKLKLVIVGHVDHGKSTLVGRLLHETGALPDGKVAAVKAMSEKRGMPFEWAFVIDAMQAERDQGITIDTTQVRFKTAARDYLRFIEDFVGVPVRLIGVGPARDQIAWLGERSPLVAA